MNNLKKINNCLTKPNLKRGKEFIDFPMIFLNSNKLHLSKNN